MGEHAKINPGPFIEFLNSVCPSLLGASKDEISRHFASLEMMNKVRHFIGDDQDVTFFIARESVDRDRDEEKKEDKEESTQEVQEKEYSITTENEVVFSPQACAVALLKRSPATFRAAYEGTLDEGTAGTVVSSAGTNFVTHIQVITMGGAADSDWSPFELVNHYLQNSFVPLFNAYSKQSEKDGEVDGADEAKVGVPNVQRKIMDLSMALMQSQQNVEIENISLPLDRDIAEAFDKAKAEGRQLTTDDFKERMNDSTFQNQLQSGVNKWSKEIQRVAKMQRDSSTGSTMQEINFWLGMEKVLNDAQQQLQTPEIQLTLNLLRGARRFLATMSFEADTGLKPAIEKVSNYLSLLRDFPINELLVATSVEQLTQAVRTIFNHMKRIRNATQYPLWRAMNVVEAVSRDLSDRLLKILSTQRLMQQESEMFSQNMASCAELFRVWNDEVGQFRQLVREQLKKRGNERPITKINCEHEHLQARIDELQKFRRHHMKLQEIIERVLVEGKESGAKAEVAAAYQLVEQVDVLDVSRRGQHEWESTKRRYDERIDHAESEITATLRDKLGAAKTATEMFRAFSRFNALFVRPRIRGAIQEYQSSLIQQVKDDVRRLQEKFKETYEGTQACKLTSVRGIPPTAGLIIWARQLERRLDVYMGRVEDVLGKGWEQHVEGKHLKQEGDAFARKMRTKHVFDDWLNDAKENKKFDVSMRIFDIQQGYQSYLLLVNFDEQVITLFKEVRNLQALGPEFRVQYAVKVNSDEAKQNYPFAMTLQEATRTYMQTCAQITPALAPMMVSYQQGVQDLITDGLHLKWDSEKIDTYTQKLSEAVFQFQQKFNELESMAGEMNQNIESLENINCHQEAVTQELLQTRFEKMQKTIDDMNLASFSNMDSWVHSLNKQIEQRLLKLLTNLSAEWLNQFKKWPNNGNSLIQEATVAQAVLELRMQNSQAGVRLVLEPQKEFAMTHWIRHYHDCLGTVCNLPLLQAARFDALRRGSTGRGEAAAAGGSVTTHRGLLALLDQKALRDVYDEVGKTVANMEEYVSTWIQYQALWSINTTSVMSRLDDDLGKWQSLLHEIQIFSSRFEGSEQETTFGPIVVDFSKVQSKVKQKYDQWHRDLLHAFGEKVQETMTEFFHHINQGRERLEAIDSSGDLTVVCMAVLKVKANAEKWAVQFEELQKAQKLLVKQRFIFPEDWMHIEQIEGEWEAFEQILARRNRILELELPKLRSVLVQKDKQLEESITQLYAEWSSQKPVQGSLKPSAAMQTIKDFDERLQMMREQHGQLVQLKKSLQMETGDVEALAPLQEEMGNLKEVWAEINTVHSRLESLKEILWTAVEPKRIKAALEELLSNMKQMPPRLHQYEAFDHIQETLQEHIKLNQVVAELKTEALKERHWKQIVQLLKLAVGFNELTLGHLWDSNLQKHQPAIREVMARAQGEMGLEQFLAEVRETWNNYDLELVPYKSKCRLIRAWDELFNQLDEHLQSVQSMKMSPFYKSFEDEGATWDDRLNKIRLVFDSWMDVQRRWVYLEGIFGSSADIQQLLPNEFQRFRTIDSEFVGLMKKVAARPKVLDAVNIEGVQNQLGRLSAMLNAVQKALGDYLEKQRSQFARFYFVGDEDLLEMIGNSRDVGAVSRHLAKMFAGLSQLSTDPENTDLVKAMQSREGESVSFVKPVNIADDPSINGWLSKTEANMQGSLAEHLNSSMNELGTLFTDDGKISEQPTMDWVSKYPCQVLLMAILADWCQKTEAALSSGGPGEMEKILPRCVEQLSFMAGKVITDIPNEVRQKLAQVITEVVHQRDVSRQLIADKVTSPKNFAWLQLMRMYWNPAEPDILQRLSIIMADATFFYGFEYLGIADKLVQTPLTDRCFLTLTQALHMRLGANPFGPAGTGKTESVKALGNTMGRFVLVFNCDESFDYQAMGRIFVGLCQVGAWGCFDEFNRLEERILSAVSEQVLTIQTGNKQNKKDIEILGKQVRLNSNVGIFVTMNPGYAGRSNLPDNLKQLFRAMAMSTPNKTMIAQVNLFNQGFFSAERLASKVVFLFDLCKDQLSSQPHYDFGLRSLKAVLACAGTMKREEVNNIGADAFAKLSEEEVAKSEQKILLRAIYDTLVPKLVAQDKPLMQSLISAVFPGAVVGLVDNEILQDEIRRLCKLRHFSCTENFMLKCMELYQIQRITHGVMLVGTVGTGKSSVFRTLLDAMEKLDNIKGDAYVVDPKAVSKEELYGKLDATTLEWTDGVFTDILRRISSGHRGENLRRQWIMFDGDVDPEWAENLNSVLDDNKLLTLPNGERLAIPPNVRIMFEVDTLKYATLATVSRCGMVWFADDVVTEDMVCSHELLKIKLGDLESKAKEQNFKSTEDGEGDSVSREQKTKAKCVEALESCFEPGGLTLSALKLAFEMEHIMTFTMIRALTGLFSMIRKGINMILEYDETHEEFPLADDVLRNFIRKYLVFAICWSFGGDMFLNTRMKFCELIAGHLGDIQAPDGLGGDTTLLDFEARVEDGQWYHWDKRVPALDIEPEKVADSSLIISTVDTTRHTATLAAWLEERKPFILSGPPGSGKTMTLMSTMKAMAGSLELASLNFSAGTTPDLLLKTFDLYCETVKTPSGLVMRPLQPNRWVVVFCDECNLPEEDKYGTQKVIMFIRQITEAGGFYRPSDRQWVSVERVQFLGACNPPTDPGRHPMSDRFLRHAPVIWVDYPGPDSLKQIYGTFNRGMLKLQPQLNKNVADAMTNTMVQFWRDSASKFTSDQQPHYLYSPRELTRWKTALHECIKGWDGMTEKNLIRLVVHEGLRIFVDRLVFTEEREWSEERLDETVQKEFGCSADVLQRPILFSCYLDEQHRYRDETREALRDFVQSKLSVFYEEALDVKLVIFDSVLDHIVRMDRVLRQPLGHLLLVGASGAGKTVLSKFVSWLNGLSVYTLKIGRNYDVLAFEADVRTVMKRAGVKGEKITFIFDESNALGPAFIERMNALLASGEVPGLFEGDEYNTLINECRGANIQGVDDAEIFARFTKQVQRNLHIVFTMNPANPDFYNRSNSSPALFNRCVIDWFGDWPHEALLQVAADFTASMQIADDAFLGSAAGPGEDKDRLRHESLSATIVAFHEKVDETNVALKKAAQKYNFITPRDFLDFINHFIGLFTEKRGEILDQQSHIDGGLKKLKETEEQVAELSKGLAIKEKELGVKNAEAEQMMSQMVKGQGEAEERKSAAAVLQKQLAEQSKVIDDRRGEIQKKIEDVEPALEAAKAAVGGVSKAALDELRGMNKPPEHVKMAMEAVVLMVRPDTPPDKVTWEAVRKIMRDANFIPSMLEYDADSLKDSTRDLLKKKYLGSKAWDLQRIKQASRMAGPVAQWVECQLQFADLLNMMEPMRNELKEMQVQADNNKVELDRCNAEVAEMEKRIQQYKEQYAALITSVEQIKNEMQSVNEKCARSTKLLSDLSSEKVRWSQSSTGFQEQTATMIGDVLVSGAFCTYIGFFDLFMRQRVTALWREQLDAAEIRQKEDLSIIDYLSKPSDRLQWKQNALPDDDLCYENAIIMRRFLRYPLIIDPSGQAITFLTNEFKSKKLLKTSFVEAGFMKSLETALRFGAPLIVMDVDKVDPILNNVLNKETHKSGPRVLISLGDQDIDFSPAFEMYMCTRDSTAQFTPDLCSRVTFVNFTVTPSSLQSQCMNSLLKSERPDVDKKREDMLKLQGEIKVRMRELEEQLLHALSNVEGSILEDVKVMATMEKIKKESAEIQEQLGKTDQIMQEIEETSALYDTAGEVAANLYFMLQRMGLMHTLYRYSLAFFLEVFEISIKTELSKDLSYEKRLQAITTKLFSNLFLRVGPGLQEADVLVFGLQLAQVRSDSQEGALQRQELDQLLKGADVSVLKTDKAALAEQCAEVLKPKLNNQQLKGLQDLHLLPCFSGLVGNIQAKESEWLAFLEHLEPEKAIPDGWQKPGEIAESGKLLQTALIIKALRLDRLIFVCTQLVESILGKGFLDLPAFNLADIIAKDSKAASPIMMVSAPGFDPSGKVTDLAQAQKKSLTSAAMGSEEGFNIADKAIKAASNAGTWVLLKNVHLAINWLTELEKKLYSMNPQQDFRLFLTMEFNPRIPANLIRLSRVYVFEPPSGVKASLQRSFTQTLTPERTDRQPVERCRLHFLLSFLHAIVLERLRFFPVGWSKKYEFSDADQACGRDIIDAWVDTVSNGGQVSNISPDKIPWDAIRSILCESIYGGRVDNEFDHAVLKAFIEHLFCAESYERAFNLNMESSQELALNSPDGRKREQFLEWIDQLPVKGSPTWVGLPVHAEQMLRINRAQHTLTRWLMLQGNTGTLKGEKPKAEAGQKKRASVLINPLADLGRKVSTMLSNLPESIEPMQRSEASLRDPLWRCYDREVGFGRSLLKKVRQDLVLLQAACAGSAKSTNDVRQLIQDMTTDQIPKAWRKFAVADITATEWLADFVKRLEQLQTVVHSSSLPKHKLWYGGLFFPEAFLTASRQAVAQQKAVSLEELNLIVQIGSAPGSDDAFEVTGLYMEGASWDAEKALLAVTDELNVALPPAWLRWVHVDSAEYKKSLEFLRVPVYLNSSRSLLISSFGMQSPKEIPNALWVQRSVCVTLWTKT
eukprot:TRINITY_DN20021_c0_g5_i1.p1 TRINITY_DN20021_c0_g5~~TRINITY_DN20021_c0_g5_i1.p1  ORF type:complete len:4603 (-),score=1119.02 TRINITY_DN20021_c0_g5_i1:34-13842(-)